MDDAWSGVWNQGDRTSARDSDLRDRPPAAVATPACIAPNIIVIFSSLGLLFLNKLSAHTFWVLNGIYLQSFWTLSIGIWFLRISVFCDISLDMNSHWSMSSNHSTSKRFVRSSMHKKYPVDLTIFFLFFFTCMTLKWIGSERSWTYQTYFRGSEIHDRLDFIFCENDIKSFVSSLSTCFKLSLFLSILRLIENC